MKTRSLMVKCLFYVFGMVLILGLIAIGCGPGAPEKESIKIGYSASLTGMYAAGQPSQGNAVILWSEMVNEKGGIYVKEYGKRLPVELVYYDDRSSPEDAIRVYEKLITVDKVDLLFPPFGTTLHIAVVPTVEKYGIPLVGSSCNSLEARRADVKYFWMTSSFPDQVMATLVDMLVAYKDEIKTVAVATSSETFTVDNYVSLMPALEAEGFDIVLDKDYPFGVTDLAPFLLEIKAKEPDAVIALNSYVDFVLWTKQSIEVGLNPKLFYLLLGAPSSAYPFIFGPATEGVTFFTCGSWTEKGPGPDSKEFHDRYVQRWNEPVNYEESALAYTACQVLEQAIEKAGTLNREEIRDVIATSEFTTIYGTFRFSGSEKVPSTPGVLQYQGGEVEVVWPPDLATSELMIPKPNWP